MAHPGQIFDPLRIDPPSADSRLHPMIDIAQFERALRSITLEHYKRGLFLLNAVVVLLWSKCRAEPDRADPVSHNAV